MSTHGQQEPLSPGRQEGSGFMKALVVEDSPIFRQVIAHSLAQLNIDVRMAATAEEGFDLLQAERTDLLILDLHLPDQSGLELCRRIRAQPPSAIDLADFPCEWGPSWKPNFRFF